MITNEQCHNYWWRYCWTLRSNFLTKIGIEVKVYDKNTEPTVAGAGIIIAPNAMQALEPYGISERIKNSATKVTALNLYPKKELFSIN